MRDTTLAEAKSTLRGWFREQDDAYLSRVVDECRAGRFTYTNPQYCLLGLRTCGYDSTEHFAEGALAEISGRHAPDMIALDLADLPPTVNATGRARVLPMVLHEIQRRNRARANEAVEVADCGRAQG